MLTVHCVTLSKFRERSPFQQNEQVTATPVPIPCLEMQASKLSWSDIYYAAKLSAWSGFSYKQADVIPDFVRSEGLEFVAQGRNKFTSWYESS
jgi:hypothetical protein